MDVNEAKAFLEEQGFVVLNEMTYDRRKFQETFFSFLDNIIENYCLIKHASLTGENTETRNHWRLELLALLQKLNRMKLVSGDKTKAMKEEYAKAEYDINDIVEVIETKFEIEGIEDDLVALATLFMDDIDNIIEVVSNGTKGEVKAFVEGL